MKLMNSKDIGKILEDKADFNDLFNFDEEDRASPCWEAKVDRDNDALVFLIDGKEILKSKLSKLGYEPTVKDLTYYIQFLKQGKLRELSKELKIKGK
jgi:hypothetical protein